MQNFWIKIGNEGVENHFKTLFVGKKKGDEYVVINKGLQDFLSDQLRIYYNFKIYFSSTLLHDPKVSA